VRDRRGGVVGDCHRAGPSRPGAAQKTGLMKPPFLSKAEVSKGQTALSFHRTHRREMPSGLWEE
jgi:hypothetical protein